MKCHGYPRGLALLAALAIISAAPPAAAQSVAKVHRVGIILTTSAGRLLTMKLHEATLRSWPPPIVVRSASAS